MASLRLIAQVAGVSTATVSRVMNGSTEVTEATREKVIEAANQLNRGIESGTQTKFRQKPKRVGLIVPDLENSYYASIVKGIHRQARLQGYQSTVAESEEDPQRELEILNDLSTDCDGIIIASPRGNSEVFRNYEHRDQLVLINREIEGLSSVSHDVEDGTRQIVQLLLTLRGEKVGYAGGPDSSWSQHRRKKVLFSSIDELKRAGLGLVDLGSFRPSLQGGMLAADVALTQKVSLIIAFNDHLAFGIMARLRERGVQVPKEIGVIGFDDVPFAKIISPALTTVAMPVSRIGEKGFAALLDLKNRTEPVQERVKGELLLRQSTYWNPSN